MWVKICGVRDEPTAEQICQLAPDAIGLNFYRKSARYVTQGVAARITEICRPAVACVGVFVNHSANEIEELVNECHLDAVQVHGDETIESLIEIMGRLPGTPVYRAWRLSNESLIDLTAQLSVVQATAARLAGCLIDAPSRVPGEYGGTGQTVSWDMVAREYRRETWPKLILAGGLNPDNVGNAIQIAQPWGVDVASGVESAPGIKDLGKVRQFIQNARGARVE